MALYTIHLPGNRRDPESLEKAVLLREGFCWPAFIFSGFWLLWHRLWLGFAGFIVLSLLFGLAVMLFGLPQQASTALEILLALAIGYEGRSMRRAKLERQGFVLAGVVSADSAEKAERKAFSTLQDSKGTGTPVPVSSYVPRHGANDHVIGLFPQPGGNR